MTSVIAFKEPNNLTRYYISDIMTPNIGDYIFLGLRKGNIDCPYDDSAEIKVAVLKTRAEGIEVRTLLDAKISDITIKMPNTSQRAFILNRFKIVEICPLTQLKETLGL